jgi:hypothetical protein
MTGKKYISITVAIAIIVLILAIHGNQSPAQTAGEKFEGAMLQGRVVSPYGPVENARVRVAGEDRYTLTDKQGLYTLQAAHPPGVRLRVTAGKEGYFNNGQVGYPSGDVGDIYLNPVYLKDRSDYRFISPVTCAQCHVKLSRYWDRSKMAHTTSNPKVLDLFNGTDAFNRQGIGLGYRLDNPKSNGNCVTCHAPSVAASSPDSVDLNTALQPNRAEWDGISCDFCHKVRKLIPDRSKPSGVAAILERQASIRGPSILVFGPYDDVVVPPMAATYNPVFDQGKYCSLCHGHFEKIGDNGAWNPGKIYSDTEREGFGLKDNTLLPIQTTYLEWKLWQDQLSSDDPNKGKKCQDCHMSWRKEMLPYDNYVVEGMARNMWATYRSPKDIRPHHFDGGTETQLKTALSMELEGQVEEGKLKVDVFVTNTNGGHWVPTGETMRSVMLLLRAFDSNGNPLKMIKGDLLPEWAGTGKVEDGNYAGLTGAVFARVLQDKDGEIQVPFWQATGIASDTRIRPKETRKLTFEFAMDDPDDEPTAKAELIYRPVIRPWAKQKNWPVKDILITSAVW